jgi:hypothetical protein
MIDKKKQPKLDMAYELLRQAYEEEMTPEQREHDNLRWKVGVWKWPDLHRIEACLNHLADLHGVEPGPWTQEEIGIGMADENEKPQIGDVVGIALEELRTIGYCTMLVCKANQIIHHEHSHIDPWSKWNREYDAPQSDLNEAEEAA